MKRFAIAILAFFLIYDIAVYAQHNVALSFTASPSVVTDYNVYRASVSGGPYAKLGDTANALAYTDSAVAAGSTYFYVVTAVGSGGVESIYSNEAAATIPGTAIPVTISIAPLTATIGTGKTQQFTTTVGGSTNTGATFATSNGSVSASGLYTAPATAGSATVTATAAADTTKSASAAVTITASTSTYVLNPTPTSFTFSAAGSQNITIHDTTPGSLPLTVASDSMWLSFCLTNTTGKKIPKVCSSVVSVATATLATGTVTVSATGLVAGTYTGHIIITAGSETGGITVNNSPYSIPVTFTVVGVVPPPLKIACSTAVAGVSGIATGSSYTMSVTSGNTTASCSGVK